METIIKSIKELDWKVDKILSEEKKLNGQITKLDKKSKDDVNTNKEFEVFKNDLNEKLDIVLKIIEQIPEGKSKLHYQFHGKR